MVEAPPAAPPAAGGGLSATEEGVADDVWGGAAGVSGGEWGLAWDDPALELEADVSLDWK